MKTYKECRKEIKSYVHEDFLDDQMNIVVEDFLNNKLEPIEMHLVCIITYSETEKLKTSQDEYRRNN